MIKKWYFKQDIVYNMIQYTYKHELAFLCPNWLNKEEHKKNVRMLKAHNTHNLLFNFKNLRFFDKIYNVYVSVARYNDGIPHQSAQLELRDNKVWSYKHHLYMTEYDFFIDIDSPSHDDINYAKLSLLIIMDELDALNCPYEIRFSGCGFHIIIPYKYFAYLNKSFNPNNQDSIYILYSTIAQKLKDEYSELIDTRIYDSRRLIKVPFSLSRYPNGKNYICYPFQNRQEVNNFNLSFYELNNFAEDTYKIKSVIFNESGNVKELIKKYGVMKNV